MIRKCTFLSIVMVAFALVLSCAKKTPEEKIQDAIDLLQKRDPLGAIVLAHEVLRENTTGPLALQARAVLLRCYMSERNFKESHRVLDEILTEVGLDRPEGQFAARTKIDTFLATRETTKALEQTLSFLEGATTGTTFWAELMMRRGMYLRDRDQRTTAAESFAQVLTNPDLRFQERFPAIEQLYLTFATTESAKAGVDFLQRVLEDNPTTDIIPNVYMIAGQLAGLAEDEERKKELFARGFSAFERQYEEATGADEKIRILVYYSRGKLAAGEVEEAAALVRKGLDAFPTSPMRINLYYHLAGIYKEHEMFDKAIEIYREIPSLFPNDPDRVHAYFHVADSHRRQKKFDLAKADLLEIRTLFPDPRTQAMAMRQLQYTNYLQRKEEETSATLAFQEALATSATVTLTTATATTTPPGTLAPTPPNESDATTPTRTIP